MARRSDGPSKRNGIWINLPDFNGTDELPQGDQHEGHYGSPDNLQWSCGLLRPKRKTATVDWQQRRAFSQRLILAEPWLSK
jgi:hypothetical protein